MKSEVVTLIESTNKSGEKILNVDLTNRTILTSSNKEIKIPDVSDIMMLVKNNQLIKKKTLNNIKMALGDILKNTKSYIISKIDNFDINLYDFDDINKPYTIEFRIKHGSTDAEELSNVCKLYQNIINYGIDLSKIIAIVAIV